MKWLIGILTALVAMAVGAYTLLLSMQTEPPVAPTITSEALLTGVNQTRLLQNVPALAVDETLQTASQARADRLCGVELSHDQYVPELQQSGYIYEKASENLAEYYTAPYQVIEAWKNSPSHYQAMIDPAYDETGIGISNCNNRIIVVQWFGKER